VCVFLFCRRSAAADHQEAANLKQEVRVRAAAAGGAAGDEWSPWRPAAVSRAATTAEDLTR